MRKIFEILILFLIGGMSYYFIEILWRGYSYFSMFLLGGLCFVSIGLVREYFFINQKPLLIQLIIACVIITSLEFLFGFILNIIFKLGVWDYSDLKFNFMGQISLRYSIFWIFLSIPVIIMDDLLKHWLFGR